MIHEFLQRPINFQIWPEGARKWPVNFQIWQMADKQLNCLQRSIKDWNPIHTAGPPVSIALKKE